MSEPEGRWRATARAISGIQLLGFFATSLCLPFLAVYVRELGVTDPGPLALWTGVLTGGPGFLAALTAPAWGALADRVGHKPMFLRAHGLAAVLFLLMGVAAAVPQLLVLRLVQGAVTGASAAGSMLLAVSVPPSRVGRAFSVYNASIQSGNVLGPLAGGALLVVVGARGLFTGTAVLLALCAVLVVVLVPAPAARASEPSPSGARAALSDLLGPFGRPALRGALIASVATQAVNASSLALIAIYAHDLARPDWLSPGLTVGLALGGTALASALTAAPLGDVVSRRDPRRVLVLAVLLLGASFVPQAVVPDALVFVGARVVTGIAIAGVMAAAAVVTRTVAIAGTEGKVFGALSAAQMLGTGVGPIAGALVAAALGIPALIAAGALASVVLAALLATRDGWFDLRAVPA